MRLTRLFSPIPLVAGQDVALGVEQANYVTRVLRLRNGRELILFDGHGGEYRAIIESASKSELIVSLGDHCADDRESPLDLHLVQCVSKGERMDLVVQKSTELGVRHITPLLSEYSVIKLDQNRAEKRREHWQKIAISACEQSGRNRPPVIDVPQALNGWVEQSASEHATKLLLVPGADKQLSDIPAPARKLMVLIGPEGGLSDIECDMADQAGFIGISLGPRVLRTETAALVALSLAQARWGDLERRG